jgi:hypothetical protein
MRLVFNLLFVYYWLIQLFSYTWIMEKQTLVIYLLYVLPISLFVLYNLVAFRLKSLLSRSENILLLIMIIYAGLMSIFNGEITNILPITLFYTSILVVIHRKYIVSLSLLNVLYIITVCYGFLMYYLGYNQYGILPGQGEGIYEKPVSLFPLAIVGSSFFSLYVLMYNYFLNKNPLKWFLIILCIYFIYFSYNRTSLICLIFFVFSLVLFQNFKNRYRFFKIIYPYIFVSVVVAIVFSADIFINSNLNKNEEIASIIQKEVDHTNEDLYGSARPFLILQQLELFLNNIITGTSSFKLINQYDAAGTETFFTAMLANIGIAFFLFLFFIHKKIYTAVVNLNLCSYLAIPIMLLVFILYGVLVMPYDMISLLIFSTININVEEPV